MRQALHRSSLVPRGFVVESACYEDDKAVITVRASGSVGCIHHAGQFRGVSIAGIGDA
ncbi:hypothetical protein ACVJGD_008402 [Bradyrhizobium sp. USDA 10063]